MLSTAYQHYPQFINIETKIYLMRLPFKVCFVSMSPDVYNGAFKH